jgi:NAD(P)-dependent dehydrogenase (short-subunit alcohol dehydrogenase family)
MRGQGSGVIINLIAEEQVPAENEPSPLKEAAFVASMQGVEGFTRQAAYELNPYGVQVYAVKTGEGIVKRVIAALEENS